MHSAGPQARGGGWDSFHPESGAHPAAGQEPLAAGTRCPSPCLCCSWHSVRLDLSPTLHLGQAGWGKCCLQGLFLLKWQHHPRWGAREVRQMRAPEEMVGHRSFGKTPVCTTDPHSAHHPACFGVSGYFWPSWQPFLFIQWVWVAMLALTFRLNWPSSLKDTEQNKERLCYKYTELGHTPLSGKPFISPVIVLPKESAGSPWCLSRAHMAAQPSSSPSPAEGTRSLYCLLHAEGRSSGPPCFLRNCH